ncbi:AAA family ATPase [Segatella copri]|uniref:AAA family ATPase n=1 Tax=Segatella copri TaxID=165179 RepID=A0AAW5TSJ1_9BACT|nr:AAA family ATPase [Segatella copri]MCW4076915.1 AAA family ATPase [Segatella copri]MCW4092680.1 AAA family ATPase [Segatella copri]MCW4108295.1 AAA family ATPase [Segatella copri]
MTTEEQYKSFILNCTTSPKSVNNYSDFKRINETIAKIKGVDSFDIYSCVHTKELQDIIDSLNNNEEFKQYEKTGSYQYSNALKTYMRFLCAKELFSNEAKKIDAPKPIGLQQIYYGAPGTGKSKTIKDLTFGESVIRTTFHPDSDYASFVGTYKPITEEVDLRDCYGKKVIDDDTKEVVKEERIAYKFIPQAFLEAYVKAWKKLGRKKSDNSDKSYNRIHPALLDTPEIFTKNKASKKQYLIIEEINRGNCAQIFGDLFQLLDRNEYGFSDYPIVADKDMQKYLEKEFAGWEITNKEEINQLYGEANMVNLIMKGERLVLPSNLYIWATMNTSDQSLFPIDSAFKRRWDWKYVPIREGRDKETNTPLNWYINTGDKQYKWWSFISKVNELIGSLTNSEDKKLGYFFCKAKDGEIDADLFVSKVIFYLWNDVFKDYGFDDKDFQDEEGKILSFDRFYEDKNGKTNVDIAIVKQFLENLGVEEFISEEEEEEKIDAVPSNNETKGNDKTKYSFNGSEPLGKGDLGISIIKQYLKEHPEMKYSEIKETFPDSMLGKELKLIGLIVTRQEIIENAIERYKQRAYGFYKKDRKFYSSDGVEFYISNWWNITNIDSIIQFAKDQGWTVEITK